ncbi:uncharacterized protein BO88DRAFT_255390 [Aspergillus vadensis CBS 113365]|uniref:Uncharacterized protein n=1 Tax=Aspergillus vadensis (strain CBS 113365 / IMI 142717 / IBT 24658) TaxID=1448311 RepID=A0A319BIN3_ASPVC|nr:hypothetical protein BO88DRAFT_255390 [Aspergillus vadensis CBS 113365]PYH70750.1 hypothetical protein BO88DRAFT_255390 [Aspergillus vadensis CBS 113365]
MASMEFPLFPSLGSLPPSCLAPTRWQLSLSRTARRERGKKEAVGPIVVVLVFPFWVSSRQQTRKSDTNFDPSTSCTVHHVHVDPDGFPAMGFDIGIFFSCVAVLCMETHTHTHTLPLHLLAYLLTQLNCCGSETYLV